MAQHRGQRERGGRLTGGPAQKGRSPVHISSRTLAIGTYHFGSNLCSPTAGVMCAQWSESYYCGSVELASIYTVSGRSRNTVATGVALTDWVLLVLTAFALFSPYRRACLRLQTRSSSCCIPSPTLSSFPMSLSPPSRPFPVSPNASGATCHRACLPSFPAPEQGGNGKAARRVSTVASQRWLAWS
jgi:hypothetical protein